MNFQLGSDNDGVRIVWKSVLPAYSLKEVWELETKMWNWNRKLNKKELVCVYTEGKIDPKKL